MYEKYKGIYFKMFREKFEQEHRQELESYRNAIRYFKAHPEYARMKVADADEQMKALMERIKQQEETLPALWQTLQPYLQAQKFFRLAMEPQPMEAREKEEAKQVEPAREELVRREPIQKRKRTNDLSL